MIAGLHPTVAAYLRSPPGPGAADADLLARFAAGRDEGAFAALVHRHGGMVFDVCRAVLGNHADADDAFQAVFLVLARKAGSVRAPGSVAAWLHGVALRTARKARLAAVRRRAREARVAVRESTADDAVDVEVRLAVHEALDALPEVYREPLVLCYLRGQTQGEAAAALGLSKAAVKKRLERGRDRLRAALVHRGFGPAVLVALALPAVSPALAQTACRVATGAAGAVPNSILKLVDGGKTMLLGKLSVAAALLTVVGVALAGGAGSSSDRSTEGGGGPPARATAAEKKFAPAPGEEGQELTGEWKVKAVEANGQPLLTPEGLRTARVGFDTDTAELTGFQMLFVGNFSFKLDAGKTPKEIDITPRDGPKRGQTFAGIYVSRADEARVCVRLEQVERGRPKGYVTNGGAGLYTLILEPAEAKDVQPPTRPPGPSRAIPPRPNKEPAPPPSGGGGPAPRLPERGGTAPAPKFDVVLRAGKNLYLVLTRPAGEGLPTSLAMVGTHLDLALTTADQVKDRDVTIVFFLRSRPGDGGGSFSGFSREQLRAIAALPADKRADKLLEHSWAVGLLPKGAVPLVPEHPAGKSDGSAPPVSDTAAPPAPTVPRGTTVPSPKPPAGPSKLTVAELADRLTGEGGDLARVYGHEVDFAGTILSIGKGVDGGTVPQVRIEGWPGDENHYGRVFVHNVIADHVGKVGDRVKVRGMIVAHGYGTLFLWNKHWVRVEGEPGGKGDALAPKK